MDDAGQSVLEKKLGTAKTSRSPIPMVEELGDNFARHLEDLLSPILKTSTSALVMSCEVSRLAPVLEGIPAPAMLGVIGVDGADDSALINIGSDLVYHIVDLRMGGNANASPMPTARTFTGIDIVLCVDVFNTLLEAFASSVAITLEAKVATAMQIVDFKQNVSNVRIAPENAEVLQLTVSLDIGPMARNGDVDIIIPLSVLDVVSASTRDAPARPSNRGPKDIWKNHMQRAAASSFVPVTTLLDRQLMSVTELENLKPGDVLPLPSTAQSRAEVVVFAGAPTEVGVATGHVGAFEGQKVVKLTSEINPGLAEYLKNALA